MQVDISHTENMKVFNMAVTGTVWGGGGAQALLLILHGI